METRQVEAGSSSTSEATVLEATLEDKTTTWFEAKVRADRARNVAEQGRLSSYILRYTDNDGHEGRIEGGSLKRTDKSFVTEKQVTVRFLRDTLWFKFFEPFPTADIISVLYEIYEVEKEHWRLHSESGDPRRRKTTPFGDQVISATGQLRANLAPGKTVPKPLTEVRAATAATASSAFGSGSLQAEAPGVTSESENQPAEAPPAFVFKGSPDVAKSSLPPRRKSHTPPPPRGSVAMSLPTTWATPFSAKTFASVDTQVDVDELLELTSQIIRHSADEHDADAAAAHETAERVLAAEATGEADNDEEPEMLIGLPPGLTQVQSEIRTLADEIDWGEPMEYPEDDWHSCVSGRLDE